MPDYENLAQKAKKLQRENKFYTLGRAVEVIAKRHNASVHKIWIELKSMRNEWLCKSGRARQGTARQQPKQQASDKPEAKFQRNDLGDIPE